MFLAQLGIDYQQALANSVRTAPGEGSVCGESRRRHAWALPDSYASGAAFSNVVAILYRVSVRSSLDLFDYSKRCS